MARSHRAWRWQRRSWTGLGLLILVGCAPLSEGFDRPSRRATTMLQFINPQPVALASAMTSPLLFDTVSDFAEGVALVRLKSSLGYIDREGRLTIPIADSNVTVAADYAEGLAVAQVGAFFGYLDRQGGWAIPVQFRQAKSFSEGLAAVQGGTKYGYINTQG